MLFADLYAAAVEAFWASPAIFEADGSSVTFVHVAWSTAEKEVTTPDAAAELLADMIRNHPAPAFGDHEPTNWLNLAIGIFTSVATDKSESDPAIQAEEGRRNEVALALEAATR